MCKRCLLPIFLALCVVYYIVYLSQAGSSLFSYHPPSMTIAFCALLTGGIGALCPVTPSLIPRQYRVFVHWTINIFAGIMAGVGFLSIYINKNLSNKAHFVTWHSTYGLTAIILLFCQLTFGAFAKYPLKLKKILSLANVRRVHIASGVFTYSVGSTALILGLFSTWFASQASLLVTFLLIGVIGVISAFIGMQVLLGVLNREVKSP